MCYLKNSVLNSLDREYILRRYYADPIALKPLLCPFIEVYLREEP
jgi:hypothetical protein